MGFGCIQFQKMPSSKVLPGEESDFQNLDKVNLTEEADVEAEDVNATDKADDTDISQTDDKEPGYEGNIPFEFIVNTHSVMVSERSAFNVRHWICWK